ncbi:unnamed protein product [Brachionus calyciflorus]|uniref:G-protein coupled receptors family 1 profile domain-containing protein n=1 Tax=Brachionus calyciflorus TaxID=104777 RepID=A0A814EIH7_9BILA|nr:unnamed protein product [Brachionus calyciflorus]
MSEHDTIDKILSYIPILTIVFGLFGNITCFFIFRFSKKFNKIPSMVFLSFVAIFDTISLFEWNLNHFLVPNFLIALERLNLFSCKIVIFIQIFSLHTSANLLSLMCVDRFVSIKSIPGSFYSRLPFGTIKSAYIWCGCITLIMFLFNIHILIFNGNYIKVIQTNVTEKELVNRTFHYIFKLHNETEICYWYSETIRIFPTMDKINLIVYNIIPFCIMLVFNILLIISTLLDNKSSKYLSNEKALKSIRKKRVITISIISITLAFMILTTPSSLSFGFFFDEISNLKNGSLLFNIFDNISFIFHSSLFFNSFITNTKFRKFCLKHISKTKIKVLTYFKNLIRKKS